MNSSKFFGGRSVIEGGGLPVPLSGPKRASIAPTMHSFSTAGGNP